MIRRVRAGCIALCLAAGCGTGADTAARGPLSLADSLIRLGDSTYREDSDSARRLWEAGLREAAGQDDSANVARALTGIGMAARQSGNWEESRRVGEQALAIKQRLGMGPRELFRSYNSLALLAWVTERLDDATALLARAADNARAAGDSTLLGMVAINTGLVAKDQGAFSRARESLLQGRDIMRAHGDSVNLGRAMNNLGMLEIALGDPIAAIASLEEARRLARLTRDSITEVNARGQLATAYSSLGDPGRAFALLDSALQMAQRGERRLEVAEDLLLIGDLFSEAGDHQHALDYYERAQAATDSVNQPEERGNILRSEAQAHAALGNLRIANTRATEARRIHREGEFLLSELNDLLVLADLAQRDRRPADAQAHLRDADRLATGLEAPIASTMISIARARVAAQAGQWNQVLAAFDRARGTLSLAGKGAEAEAFALRSKALSASGRNEAALAAGQQAIEAVESVRDRYAAGELRTSYTSARADIFAQQVLLLLRLGRTTEAFQVADAARGRALLEHLTQARADLQSGTGTTQLLEQEGLLRRIETLLGRLREREQTVPRERSSLYGAVTAGLRDSVETLRAEYAALVARSAATKGTSPAILGVVRPPVSEVQRSLDSGEVLLEYLVTPERLLIFVVAPNAVTVHSVRERAQQLASRVQLAREFLRLPEPDAATQGVLKALFEIVLGPVVRSGELRGVKRLIVVPHGVLTYLPFGALQDSASRYVADQYALLHLPTSAALPAVRTPLGGASRPVAAEVFAPAPASLPATRQEAEAVASVLDRAQTFIGSSATESRFRLALQRGGVVHVASHASLNSRNPLFSYIELAARRGGNASDNGRLEAHELLAMRIAAPLVFLSGCETAIGGAWSTRFDTGEDYATIAQTLLYAGARNVVATLWRIDDVGAAEFTRHFYEALRRMGYAEAVAEAQRKLMRDPRYGSPYYWAAYQVSGSGLAPSAKTASASDKPQESGFGLP